MCVQPEQRSAGTAPPAAAASARRPRGAPDRRGPRRRPSRWCSISSASEPSANPSQRQNASRYDRKNCAGLERSRPSARRAGRPRRRPARRAAGDRSAAAPGSGRRCTQSCSGLRRRAVAWCVGLARPRRLELAAIVGRHVVERRVLAELQRADVGDDRPAVRRRDLRGVAGIAPKPCVITSKKCPARRVAQARRSWNDGGGGSRAARSCRCRRRCAPWQGAQ